MTDHYCLIVSAATVGVVNTLLESAGFGPDNFSNSLVRSSDADDAPATHYWCGLGPQYLPGFMSALSGRSFVTVLGDLNQANWNQPAFQANNVKQRRESALQASQANRSRR